MSPRAEHIEEIMVLMARHRVDLVEVEGIKVVMTRHAPAPPPARPKSATDRPDAPDEDIEQVRAELHQFANGSMP